MGDPVAELRFAVEAAASTLRDGAEAGGSAPTLERPPKPEFGDYSTNAAMLLAPALGEQPRGTAEKLAEELGRSLEGSLEKVEVAGPGFLNLFLADAWYRRAAAELASQGERLGRPAGSDEVTERINVEFVSANPTGPVTAAGGRGAALGDSIARVLEFAGHPVTREYYINDRGGQIDRFAASIAARMTGRTAAGGRVRGRLRHGLGQEPRSGGHRPGRPRRRRAPRDRADGGGGRGDPPPLRRHLRRLVLGALPARVRRRRAGPRPGVGGRPRLRERGRHLAADHHLRRRQGPRPDPLGRRVHLLPLRHRLSPRQARPGLRQADRRARSRPPRLRRAPPGRAGRAGLRAGRARGGDHAAGPRGRGRTSGRRCRSEAATSSRSTS